MGVQLFLNGQEADIYDGEEFPLSVDKQIEDIYTFNELKGSGGSRTITIPGTQRNLNIFGSLDTVQTTAANYRGGMVAEIRVGTITVETGRAFLQQINLRQDLHNFAGQSIELLFISDNSEWFDLMSPFDLSDLTLSNFTLTDAGIRTLESVNASISPFCFALIKWKEWENNGFVNRYEYTPCIFVREIIEQAFNLIGYTVSSNFIVADFFNRLIIPCPPKPYGDDFYFDTQNATATTAGVIAGGASTVFITFDDDTTPPNFNAGANYNAGTGVFTAPYDGRYYFSFEVEVLNITVSSGVGTFAAAFLKNGATTLPAFPFFYAPVVNNEILRATLEVDLVAGDTIQAGISPGANVTNYDLQNGRFDMRMQQMFWAFGAKIYWSYFVPKFNLLDLIRGVSAMFDLKIGANSAAKTVTIEPRTDFYNSQGDKTDKIDPSADSAKIINDIPKYYLLKYQDDDKDANLQEIGINDALPYGSGQFDTGISSGDTETIENPFFAATVHLRDFTISGFAGSDIPPQIPVITPTVNGEPIVVDNKFDFKPRILYFQGRDNQNIATNSAPAKYGSISIASISPTSRQRYPMAYMVNYYDTDGFFPTLMYGDVSVDSNRTLRGLIKSYYTRRLATISRGVQLDTGARVNLQDVLALDFRERWVVLGNTYYLQLIKNLNYTRQASAEVSLIEEVIQTAADEAAVTSSAAVGHLSNVEQV